ncbi:MAG: hypothetical protein JOY71_21730 [Acetobacteraceae bacterium]|nr:hypothetical protein [Acetobacteraceae bacterium]
MPPGGAGRLLPYLPALPCGAFDDNVVERSIRLLALAGKNALFAGSVGTNFLSKKQCQTKHEH